MRIEWTIQKRAGHLRPKLHYSMTLEDFEIELAVPMVQIASTIPKPLDAGQHYVWPGTKECGREKPTQVYDLCSSSHKTGHHIVVDWGMLKKKRVVQKKVDKEPILF